MRVSVIVCTRNRADMLAECLSSLFRNEYLNTEIIVVDQSTDGLTEQRMKTSSDDQRLKYIKTKTVGLSKSRNIGIEASEGEIVSFMDDDCLASDDWIESIVAEFRRDPEVMAVYGRVLPGGVSQAYTSVAIKVSEAYEVFYGKANPWRLGHGANVSYRRQVFGQIGCFDEMLGPGAPLKNCDDADMAYRALKRGLKIIYSPKVLNYHRQWRNQEKITEVEQDYAIGTGALYIKHLRCGDPYILKLMIDKMALMLTSGLRGYRPRSSSARSSGQRRSKISIFKQRVRKGYHEVVYTLYGMFLGLRRPIDKKQMVYIEENYVE
jgi:glycosyltransferase involved in cell wall biosynthesis